MHIIQPWNIIYYRIYIQFAYFFLLVSITWLILFTFYRIYFCCWFFPKSFSFDQHSFWLDFFRMDHWKWCRKITNIFSVFVDFNSNECDSRKLYKIHEKCSVEFGIRSPPTWILFWIISAEFSEFWIIMRATKCVLSLEMWIVFSFNLHTPNGHCFHILLSGKFVAHPRVNIV